MSHQVEATVSSSEIIPRKKIKIGRRVPRKPHPVGGVPAYRQAGRGTTLNNKSLLGSPALCARSFTRDYVLPTTDHVCCQFAHSWAVGLVLVPEAVSPQVLGKAATGKSAGCPACLPVGTH